MDWLRKAANWLGGLVKQANPVRAGVSTFQQASREFNRQRPRIEQATRQVARQIQPPKPRLDYQAAMRALQAMQQQGLKQANILKNANPTNITKPVLGVTLGDIAREIPSSATGTAKGIGTAVATAPSKIAGITPALIQYSNDNPLQRAASRSGGRVLYKKNDAQINRRLQKDKEFINKYVVPEAYNISNNMDTRARNIQLLKANQREAQAAQAGEAIGNMGIDLGINSVAPGAAALYYGTKYGGDTGRTVYNATGDANLANKAGVATGLVQAALAKFSADQLLTPKGGVVRNLITKPLVGAVGASGERVIANTTDKLTYDPNRNLLQGVPEAALTGGAFGLVLGSANQAAGKLKGVKNTDGAIQARLKNRPANLQAIENNPNLTNAQRLALAQGDTGQAGLQLSPAQRQALLKDFQASADTPKVRIVNGKKVFAPNYNPTDAKGKLGSFKQNFNEPDARGRFTANELPGRISHVTKAENAEAILKSGALKQSKAPLKGVEGAKGVSFAGAKDAKFFGWGGEDNVRFEYKTSDVKKLGKLKVGKQGTFPEGSLPADVPNKYIRAAYAGTPETAAKLKAAGVKNVYIDPELNLKGGKPVNNNYDGPLPKKDPLEALKIEDRLKSKYPGVDFSVYDNGRTINVSKIVVPKTARNSGIGTKAMQEIISEADRSGKTITLTPSSDYGGSKVRLKEFYKRLGFVENKGRTKDLAISEDMYRLPTNKSQGVRDSLADGLPNPGRKPIIPDPLEALKAEARKYKSAEEFTQHLGRQKAAGDPATTALLSDMSSKAQKLIDGGMSSKAAANRVFNDTFDTLRLQPENYKTLDEFINAQGKPFYHGTDANFDRYSLGNFGKTDQGFTGKGIYLSGRKGNARQYGKNVVESYANLKNPLEYTDSYIFGAFSPDGLRARLGLPPKASAEEVTAALKSRGHDGVVIHEDTGTGIRKNEEVVVLDPTQVRTKQQLTDLYNQATKPERFNELVPKSYLEPDAPKGKLTAKEKAMGKALGLSEADTLAAKQGGTGLDRTVNLDGTQAIPGAPKGQAKRGFVKSLQEDWGVPSKVSDQLPQGYKQIKNADTFAQAKQIVDSDPASLQRLLSKPKSAITELDQAQLQIHLRKAIEGDNFDSAKRIATKIDVNARQAGRTVQILAAWKKTTPEGALSHAYKVVEEANTKYPGKNFEVTPEKAKNIRRLAENIQKTTAGTRERQVAQALLEKEIRGIVPASIGRKISSIQTFAQLLNPKTAIRNVIGNAVFSGMENISTTVGAGVDKLVGIGTKQRSVTTPSLGAQGKGFLKGIKYGVEDTNLGIRTSGSETQFEIKPNVFQNKILKGVEKALGYELSVPDKAFYQAAFEDSMNNQMRAMKLSKPNGRVVEQANQEALYRTFQNDSKLATILSGVKKGLNFNKEFGAGDFIMKYPRTPGNIAQAGLFDYSPLGGAQGIYRLGQGIRQGTLDPFAQREAVMQIGRGLTGTGLLAGGAALAKSGVVQGRPDTDKDVNNMDRSIGGGPYTFNVSALTRGFRGGNQPGDKILNYDWLQPTAIPVTMGANIANRKSAGDTAKDLIGTVDAGVQTLVDQPVLQGLARLFGSTGTQGRGLAETLLQTAQSVPSSFMPSLLNQVGQYTDPISRSTYDPNFIEGAKRQVMGRVPGLRTQLQPNVDTFGNERKMYEDNNFFNVFFNPAFQRTYNPTPEAQLVLDLNQATGETSQFPRVAPRKITVNGEQTTLTPEQITEFQKYTGEKTKLYYQSLNSDPRFQALSNEDKIKVMQNALTDIAAAGKIAILGQNPEGADKRVKAIVDFGPVDFIPKPKKVKQPKAPKPKRSRRKSTRRVGTRSRRRGRVAKAVPKVPRLTSGIKTSGTAIRRVSAGRTPRIKFASAPKSSKTVKIKLG